MAGSILALERFMPTVAELRTVSQLPTMTKARHERFGIPGGMTIDFGWGLLEAIGKECSPLP